MPLARVQSPVYWIEADEEASLFTDTRHAAPKRRSLLAYILLRRTVIAHPADLWQSRDSNDLFLNVQALPLLKESVQIHLGDSATIREYITDRKDKLQRDVASARTNVELQQYEQYGPSLDSQSDQLDDIFTRSGATFKSHESRDKKFRNLIRLDLENEIPFGSHLAACIRQGLSRRDADRLSKTLNDLARDRRRFVSIDGIISRLTDAGCQRAMLNRIHQRLQVLHWESRREGAIELPLLSHSVENRLDSADPDVFWTAIDRFLGGDFQRTLMTLPWQTALSIAHELRSDPIWTEFIETYDVIVQTVERSHLEIAEEVVSSQIAATYPTFLGIMLNTRPDKWTVFSWVCHAGSWAAGIPEGLSLILRLGSAAAVFKKGLDHAKKVRDAYFDSERKLIESRIRRLIRDATRTK